MSGKEVISTILDVCLFTVVMAKFNMCRNLECLELAVLDVAHRED